MKKTFHYGVSFVSLFVFWYALSTLLGKNFFPSPIETIKAFQKLIAGRGIWIHLLASSKRIIFGTLFGTLIAVPLGTLLGYDERIDGYIGNIFNILYPIPKVVFLPMIVVCMGIGDAPKIFLIALVIFFQLTLVARGAVKHIPSEQIAAMNTLNPTKLQYFKYLIIPACLPEILLGLRSTIGISTALLFITENFASVTGLGYYITSCMDTRDFENMYAGILILALLGLTMYAILHLIERCVCRWKYIESVCDY